FTLRGQVVVSDQMGNTGVISGQRGGEEPAAGALTLVVALEEGLAGQRLGEPLEEGDGELLPASVYGVIGQPKTAHVDSLGCEGLEGELVDDRQSVFFAERRQRL